MKKVTSAALLALKLTWKLVLLFFFLIGGVQLFSVYQELMPGGVPLQTTFGFEHLIQTAVMPAGKYWMAFLAISLSVQASQSKGSKTVYMTSGHGEATLAERVQTMLTRNRCTLSSVNLLVNGAIPADWLGHREPADFVTEDGRRFVFDWYSDYLGVRQFYTWNV